MSIASDKKGKIFLKEMQPVVGSSYGSYIIILSYIDGALGAILSYNDGHWRAILSSSEGHWRVILSYNDGHGGNYLL